MTAPTLADVLRDTAIEHTLTCYPDTVFCGGDLDEDRCGWEHSTSDEREQVRAWAQHLAGQQIAALVAAGLATITLTEENP